jgi:hypothetical protein
MVDINECALWPLLRLTELHRLDADYETCDVVPAIGVPCKLNVAELASSAWNSAERSGLHRKFDPFLEIAALQG